MIMPNIPHQMTPVLNPDGTMHDSWHRFFSQMTESLQSSNSEEGFIPGAQPAENIALLDNENNKGRMLYDQTNQEHKINNDGKYRAISTKQNLTTKEIAAIPTSRINNTWVTNKDNGKLLVGVNNAFREVAYT
jgi:hypothetical protein